ALTVRSGPAPCEAAGSASYARQKHPCSTRPELGQVTTIARSGTALCPCPRPPASIDQIITDPESGRPPHLALVPYVLAITQLTVSRSPPNWVPRTADSGWACSGWVESPGGIATSDGSPCGWPARAWAASAAAAAAANSSGVA